MARKLDPKCKQCRRIGEKLFLKGERCFSPKCAMVKRNYTPGMHGVKRNARLSEYGIQLKEKQKAARTYQILEKQFVNYYFKAIKMKGETGENMMRLLETRLDNTIYRIGIAQSRSGARQLVNHGHFLVNGKKVDIPSYQVKIGNIISIKDKSENKTLFKDHIKKINKKNLPSWLTFTEDKYPTVKVVAMPSKNDIMEGINTAMIVEFYSR
ncbi:30S ribosomal protein S4 [Patescibacteria group bacterium]|nr:30S ribosomal protein S4 [Patescibacteria group bacterium]MBU0963639.1 30S ribosomal protein S4 [Patescibacteria group bacterium]